MRTARVSGASRSSSAQIRNAPAGGFAGIYGIVDAEITRDPVPLLEALLAAQVAVVQYRAKAGVDRVVLAAMLERTRAADATLIVNDDVEAALLADGLHVGQEDLAGRDVAALRARLGARVFGISCGTASEARVAEAAGADYVGVGPYAATATKGDAGPAIGVSGIAVVVAATRLPVVAIGGIGLGDLAAVASAGAAMAAVITAIARAENPAAAARAFVAGWTAARA